jgi:glutamate formiminotransferase
VAPLLAVPNFSEGADAAIVARIAGAAGGALDVHADADHNRSVMTLAGEPGMLAGAVLRAATVAVEAIDLRRHEGVHPRVGAIDVAPVVHLDEATRGAACAEALVLADLLGDQLELPVFLYGQLAGGRTRADLRRGGPGELRRRLARGELRPDFGPPQLHPSAGAVLVAARPPLVAFNVELAPGASLEDARAIAARIREGGDEGLPGVRAIGLALRSNGTIQVSTNIEDHRRTSAADVVAAVGRAVASLEFVGLPPAAAVQGLPEGIPLRWHGTLEAALARRALLRRPG